jgi:hypothetical protein
MLRDRMARQGPDDLAPLMKAGALALPREEVGHDDTLFDGLVEDINGRIKVFGVEVTLLHITIGSDVG